MACPSCGAQLSPGARFCSQCGTPAPAAPGGGSVSTGNVSGTGIAIGSGASAQVRTGVSGEELARLLAPVRSAIEARAPDPDVDPRELTQAVEEIEREVAKGEAASPSRVRRWLRLLADAAPDVLEVTASALLNPVAGVAEAIRKVAAAFRDDPDSA